MNCPYCDETVHVMSKFCPKCGLPLKDDATVMGAYATDDTGPSIYVIGGGAAAVLAIALIIGWATSQNGKKPVEQVQRQQINNPLRVPSAPAVLPGSGFATTPGFSAPSAPSANYSPQVKWAYTPPAQPAPRPQRFIMPEPEGPEAPPLDLIREMRSAPKEPTRVAIARPETPPIPPAPFVPEPITLQPGQVLQEAPAAVVEQTGESALPRLNEEGRELERRGIITYDPVQERYVIVPGRGRRRSNRIREIAPRSVAPSSDVVTPPNVEGQ